MDEEEPQEVGDADEGDDGALTCLLYFLAIVGAALWLVREIAVITRDRWSPWVSWLWNCSISEFEEVKRDHFASMTSIVSCDPELRKTESIRILEIGVGTGANLAFYPEGSHLVAVDFNPNFKPFYEAKREKFPRVATEDVIITTGERLEMLKDNSMDVVVVTLFLCSLDDMDVLLKEIHRVLVPGGKYYFMEHTPEFDMKNYAWRKQLQDVFAWLGLWAFVFDRCRLNRDILPHIHKAGFSSVHAQKYHAPLPFIFGLIRPQLKGVATK